MAFISSSSIIKAQSINFTTTMNQTKEDG